MPDTDSVKRETAAMLNVLTAFSRPNWGHGRRALSGISRMRSHALARAIADNAFFFPRPDWTTARISLENFSRMLADSMIRAITGNLLDAPTPPTWSLSRRAMISVFGFDLPHHLFRASPVNWIKITERQATIAFANFLNIEDRTIRNKRIHSFLQVLAFSRDDCNIVLPNKASVKAEAPDANRKRIDLLLKWRDANDLDRGAVVEAKFGHHITDGQLEDYAKHLEGIEKKYRESIPQLRENPLLFIVSSRLTSNDEKMLREHKYWSWISWRSLLLAYDRTLESDCDDDDFRQFRRTLWERAGT